jgi:hypothetical protein
VLYSTNRDWGLFELGLFATDHQAPHQMQRHEVIVAFVYSAVPIARYTLSNTLSILLASLWD